MFSRNKKKINSRVRFQSSRFRYQLKQARGYKRPSRSLPETDFGILLAKIGLGSWQARFFSLVVLLFLVYIAYIPNFLFIKHINVTGGDQTARSSLEASINSFLEKNLPLPQKNLALLSKNRLKEYLLKNNSHVLKINSVDKQFPSTLNVEITPRVDEFIIQNGTSEYSVSNDGLVTGEVYGTASASLPTALGLIKLSGGESLAWGQQALTEGKPEFLNKLRKRLPEAGRSAVDYYEIEKLATPDLAVYLKNGLKVLFDFTSNSDKTLDRLKLLLSQFSDSDLKRLFYADMRFEDRGYLCYKGTPCVKDINLSNASAMPTSTPDNLPN